MENLAKVVKELSSSLTKFTNDIKAEMQEMKSEMSSFKSSLDHVKKYICSIQSGITDLGNRIKAIEEKNSNLDTKLNSYISRAEQEKRLNNLIIYNLDEEFPNVHDNLEETIVSTINEKLKVDFNIKEINSVNLLGKKGIKNRPILLKLTSGIVKWKILKSAHLLKGSKISISQDYTKEIREKRKLLYPYLLKAKAENVPAKLVNDKLLVAGHLLTISDLITNISDLTNANSEDFDTYESGESEKVDVKKVINARKNLKKRKFKEGTTTNQGLIKNWILNTSK